MPITVSAKKKLRQDVKRRLVNQKTHELMKRALREARKTRSLKTLAAAFSAIDQASKKHIIHKNTAARLKSRLTRNKLKVKSENPKAQFKSKK